MLTVNDNRFKILIFLLIYFCVFENSYAKQPKVNWAKTELSAGLAYAKERFKADNLPTTETLLLNRISVSIEQGIVVKKVLNITYLPTFAEAHDEGTEYIYWDEATTDLIITEASVVLQNGRSMRMSPENIRVRDGDQYNTFTNNKEVLIPLSGVALGSMIVLEYEKRTDLKKLESNYSEFIYPIGFQQDVSKFEFELEHDDSLDINWLEQGGVVKCDYLVRRLYCEGQTITKLPYEASMQWRDEIPSIVIAQKANWNQVVKSTQSAFDKSDYDSDKVKNFALKLIDGVDDLNEKIQLLHSFVSRSIRYVSMSELGHRITPHTFDEVVENLFGDCKDKSALLVGMLRAIGIDAFPVLVATDRRNPKILKVPSNTYFDHMVVCFDKDQKRFCLDPTNTSTGWEATAPWIQGRVALELQEGAKPNTIRLDDYKWVMSATQRMVFDSSANVAETQSRIFSGAYAGQFRDGLLGYEKNKRNELLLEQYQSNVSTLAEPEFEIKFLDSQTASLEVNSSASYEPYYSSEEDLSISEYDSWLRMELKNSKVSAEKYGVWVDGSYIKSEIIYDLGALWKVDRLPAILAFDHDIANLQRKSRLSDNDTLIVTTELRIKSHFIQPEDIKNYNKMIDILLTASNIYVQGVLKK